jgi:cell shape-determining protein MreC
MSFALQKYVFPEGPEYNEKKLGLFIQRLTITFMFVFFAYIFSDTVKKSFGIGPALAQIKNEELANQIRALSYEFRFIVGKLMRQRESVEKEVAALREEIAELQEKRKRA